ncbi:30S ribosomal protein S4e [Candidatus Woesearchaeota archaeon CG_4_10_14_0_2_um_filter_33_13]|nr:MAG: 30S ribosomal protein S4e [Candidatus Woesearchaeota archaeon CG_4_10_14_0_2_um_filter_33_13]
MKNHLKRLTSPRTWAIDRKANTFISRPNAGAHSFENGLALGVILRDFLHLAETSYEVKKMLKNNQILVDGRQRKDHKFIVGLFDVLQVKELNKIYRVVLTRKGKLAVQEITEEESTTKPCKIVGKSVITAGKIQYNLYDGKSVTSEVSAKVGDSFLLTLPDFKVKELLPLTKGASVFLTKGKHIGDFGSFKEIKGQEAVYLKNKEEVYTSKKYLFVVGKEKPSIKLNETK